MNYEYHELADKICGHLNNKVHNMCTGDRDILADLLNRNVEAAEEPRPLDLADKVCIHFELGSGGHRRQLACLIEEHFDQYD
jgi:hypothetical protein